MVMMKKVLYIILIPLLFSISINSCKKEEEDKADTSDLGFSGYWHYIHDGTFVQLNKSGTCLRIITEDEYGAITNRSCTFGTDFKSQKLAGTNLIEQHYSSSSGLDSNYYLIRDGIENVKVTGKIKDQTSCSSSSSRSALRIGGISFEDVKDKDIKKDVEVEETSCDTGTFETEITAGEYDVTLSNQDVVPAKIEGEEIDNLDSLSNPECLNEYSELIKIKK